MLAKINDKSIFYEVYGNGEPLILIHGLGVTHQMWKWQIEDLAQDFQVIVYDLPGHGRSENKLAERDVYRGLADDLRALMDHLSLAKAAICGLSLGGRLGLAMAIYHPERVSKLIVSSGFEGLKSFAEKFNTWLGTRTLKKMTLEKIVEISAKSFFPKPEHAEAREVYRTEGAKVAKDAIIQLSLAAKEVDFTSGMSGITVPVLFLAGEKEALMSQIAQRMVSLVPGAQLEIIPGVGHVWNMEKPGLFNQTVREFLQ